MLQKIIVERCTDAFQNAYPEYDFRENPIEVTLSTHSRFGHYQCNSAMKLAKVLKQSPKAIAERALSFLKNPPQIPVIQKAEVAGAGFINIDLNSLFISDYAEQLRHQTQLVEQTVPPQKIVIDFSSPNTAKEMHVGHLRSTIIGDALARLFEAQGDDVLRLNHLGDWGTAFGMLIAYLKQQEPAVLSGKKTAELSLLVSCYKQSKALFDADPEFKRAAQQEVVALQSGDLEALKAWEIICDISRKAYQEIYDFLDINIQERGESFYNPFLKQVIEDVEAKKFVTISDGAKCIFLEGYTNREGEPLPFMLQKSDGGYNYATTDMAAIKHRIQVEKADRLLYVIDSGQSIHLQMLFTAAEKVGYLDPQKVKVDHVAFGLVLGPDGKKFKTRSGETERLMDLLTNAIDKAESILRERNETSKDPFSEAEIHSIARVLGINAIKYADLSCNRLHDYTFSYDRMLRFEGNTAAFLMYSYVRIHGIKRKIKNAAPSHIALKEPAEIALGLHLCQFNDLLASIAVDLMPNRLCEYLFELSEKFNAFFRDCRVEGDAAQNERLALCELTQKVLQTGMHLLGLQAVERM